MLYTILLTRLPAQTNTRISIPLYCCVVGGHTDVHCLNRFEDWVSSCLFNRDFSLQAYDEFMVHAQSGLESLVASGVSPLPGGDRALYSKHLSIPHVAHF